jgi:hypothetical protein
MPWRGGGRRRALALCVPVPSPIYLAYVDQLGPGTRHLLPLVTATSSAVAHAATGCWPRSRGARGPRGIDRSGGAGVPPLIAFPTPLIQRWWRGQHGRTRLEPPGTSRSTPGYFAALPATLVRSCSGARRRRPMEATVIARPRADRHGAGGARRDRRRRRGVHPHGDRREVAGPDEGGGHGRPDRAGDRDGDRAGVRHLQRGPRTARTAPAAGRQPARSPCGWRRPGDARRSPRSGSRARAGMASGAIDVFGSRTPRGGGRRPAVPGADPRGSAAMLLLLSATQRDPPHRRLDDDAVVAGRGCRRRGRHRGVYLQLHTGCSPRCASVGEFVRPDAGDRGRQRGRAPRHRALLPQDRVGAPRLEPEIALPAARALSRRRGNPM